MLKIIQDTETNISLGGYVYPVGTVFTGFLIIAEDTPINGNAALRVFYQWYVDGGITPVVGLNIPCPTTIQIIEVYTAKFNQALTLNSEIIVSEIERNNPIFTGKIEIVNI